jgi:hypothetical protein
MRLIKNPVRMNIAKFIGENAKQKTTNNIKSPNPMDESMKLVSFFVFIH